MNSAAYDVSVICRIYSVNLLKYLLQGFLQWQGFGFLTPCPLQTHTLGIQWFWLLCHRHHAWHLNFFLSILPVYLAVCLLGVSIIFWLLLHILKGYLWGINTPSWGFFLNTLWKIRVKKIKKKKNPRQLKKMCWSFLFCLLLPKTLLLQVKSHRKDLACLQFIKLHMQHFPWKSVYYWLYPRPNS